MCTEDEMILIQKEENMTIVKVNNNILYYELIIKYNVDITGIFLFLSFFWYGHRDQIACSLLSGFSSH